MMVNGSISMKGGVAGIGECDGLELVRRWYGKEKGVGEL